MLLLDLTLPSPEENLALDEALLDEAEDLEAPRDVLRFWESNRPMVVLGRSSKAAEEAQLESCSAADVPVLRRCSGGAAILAGPGCLMYGVVLSYDLHPELRSLDLAHCHVLSRLREALSPRVPGLQMRGTSDLAIGEYKVSGNSLRCKRRYLLYHGTLLYGLDPAILGEFLGTPPRQPAYRKRRTHQQFVANLPLTPAELKPAICAAFRADTPLESWPRAIVSQLVAERYSQASWNLRH